MDVMPSGVRSGRRGAAGNPSCSPSQLAFCASDTRRPHQYCRSRRRHMRCRRIRVVIKCRARHTSQRLEVVHSPICLLLRINPVDRPRCIRNLVGQQPLLFFTPLEALHDRRRQPKPPRSQDPQPESPQFRRSPLTVMRSRDSADCDPAGVHHFSPTQRLSTSLATARTCLPSSTLSTRPGTCASRKGPMLSKVRRQKRRLITLIEA